MTRGALAALWLLPLCAASAMAPAVFAARLDTETPRRLASGARLDWVPCWFEPAFGEETRCAHFFPSGEPQVRLPVVVLKSMLPDTRDSPVLYVPPGPGPATGLTARGLAPWWYWQGLARWPHDLVLYDVRGAGLARPRLDCPEIIETDRAGLERALSADDDLRALQTAARRCLARLRAGGIDPRHFSTERHVADIGELLALLGRKDWNLWGVSYGTRLALHAVREFPGRIRSVTLDSAYPPEVNGWLAKPQQFGQVAGTLAAVCAHDARCAGEHPALARQIAELTARLKARPVTLDVEKWPGLWRHRLAINDYRLRWMLFLESYRPPWQPRAPRAIARALAGDYEPLLPLAENFIETLLDPDYSHGTYYSTVCPEDLPGVAREAWLAEVGRHPAVAQHLAPEWDRQVCHDWDAGLLPARYREPVRSTVPALFLSGAWDTVTPPSWAARAARGFTRGRHYTLPASHAVTWENDCATGLVWEFLANPARAPAPACWRELEAHRNLE